MWSCSDTPGAAPVTQHSAVALELPFRVERARESSELFLPPLPQQIIPTALPRHGVPHALQGPQHSTEEVS